MRFIALLITICSAAVASATHGAEQRPVRITLQSVGLANSPSRADDSDSRAVVFSVTNGGAKPVMLLCCGASFVSTNSTAPIPFGGFCNLPPFTNATLTLSWKPDKVGTQW